MVKTTNQIWTIVELRFLLVYIWGIAIGFMVDVSMYGWMLSSQLFELGGSTCGWLKVIWFRMDYGLAEGSLRYKVTKKQMGLLNKAWCYRWSKWIYNRTGLHSKSISWDISWLPATWYICQICHARGTACDIQESKPGSVSWIIWAVGLNSKNTLGRINPWTCCIKNCSGLTLNWSLITIRLLDY